MGSLERAFLGLTRCDGLQFSTTSHNEGRGDMRDFWSWMSLAVFYAAMLVAVMLLLSACVIEPGGYYPRIRPLWCCYGGR
jgi:hypothetical protein